MSGATCGCEPIQETVLLGEISGVGLYPTGRASTLRGRDSPQPGLGQSASRGCRSKERTTQPQTSAALSGKEKQTESHFGAESLRLAACSPSAESNYNANTFTSPEMCTEIRNCAVTRWMHYQAIQ